jgi:hypothetical protein
MAMALGLIACCLQGREPARHASCPQADRIERLGAALETGKSVFVLTPIVKLLDLYNFFDVPETITPIETMRAQILVSRMGVNGSEGENMSRCT